MDDIKIIGTLAEPLERCVTYFEHGRKTICNPTHLLPTATAQQIRSLQGQRLVLLRFHGFMFDLSDEQVRQLHQAVRKEAGRHQDDKFVDLSLIEDAAAYQLCLRSADAFNSDAVAEEIAESFALWLTHAKDHPDITAEHLIATATQMLSPDA